MIVAITGEKRVALRELQQVEGGITVVAAGLTKRFGSSTVLRDVAFSVTSGETLVVLGPNGAGKTTLLKILAGLLRPTSGSVVISGDESPLTGVALRKRIAFLGHNTFLYESLTGRENLLFFAKMYDVSDPRRRVGEALGEVGLLAHQDLLVSNYSRGMKQRLAIARSLLHNPALLLLDEPFASLDMEGAEKLSNILLRSSREGSAIILTTHDLERGLALADRLLYIVAGRAKHFGNNDFNNVGEFLYFVNGRDSD